MTGGLKQVYNRTVKLKGVKKMDIQERKAMAEGIKNNTFKELSFRVQCHLDTIDLDKFWKACQYAVNLSRKIND